MAPNRVNSKHHEVIIGSVSNPFSDLAQFEAITLDSEKVSDTEQMKQRSVEWFLHRWDKFTGSRIPDLMKQGRGKGELWGETARGIILEIASYMTMTDEGREAYAIEQMYKEFRPTAWGNKYEPEARAKYAERTGYIVNEVGFKVHDSIPYLGGSFDGEIAIHQGASKDFYELQGIIEIKCPYDPIKHCKNRDLSQGEGITIKHEYYGQIQNNIEVAGVQWCDFVSYDPRCKPEYQLVIIRVMRDQIYIDAMLDRVHKAKRILDGYMAGKSMDEMCVEVETITEPTPQSKKVISKFEQRLNELSKCPIERALERKETEWHDEDWHESNE